MRLHLSAWKNGLKSLYYLKSSSLLTKKVVPALIVTREECPWCDLLKEQLKIDGIVYEEITKDQAIEKGYWNPEWKTVPQLWLYKQHIGGYNDYVTNRESPNPPPPPTDAPSNQDSEKTYETCAACEA
jgi:glutaredoxin